MMCTAGVSIAGKKNALALSSSVYSVIVYRSRTLYHDFWLWLLVAHSIENERFWGIIIGYFTMQSYPRSGTRLV